MNAIEGTTARISTLVDGTLRVTIDIEPYNAQKAFLALGIPGTAVAVAVLGGTEEEST
jgi:hypothetical protein